MNHYFSYSNQELITKAKRLVGEERKLTGEILHLLREVEKRRLHLELGYGSLFEFATKELGYDEASASRRIQAMRLICDIPEVEALINTGDLSLTVAAQAQRFFKAEEKALKTYTQDEKREVIQSLEKKSIREAERELIKISPLALPKERERVLTEDTLELRLAIPTQLKSKFDRIRNLINHKNPNPTMAELLDQMADMVLEKLDPLSQKQKEKIGADTNLVIKTNLERVKREVENQKSNDPQEKNPIDSLCKAQAAALFSRYISAKIKRSVWLKCNGRCFYINPITKIKCSSQYKLEIEHIMPFALGGSNNLENLELLCSAHNKYRAIQTLGSEVMAPYLRS